MFDFAISNDAVKELFLVFFIVDKISYLYTPFASNHLEALWTAVTKHRKGGLTLPVGTRCHVGGVCRDRACDCGGKDRVIIYVGA